MQHQAFRRAPMIVASIFGGLLIAPSMLSAQTTIVRPTEIDDILMNPGMGIETFQRFSGQAVNEGVRWSEVGPETAAPIRLRQRPSTSRHRASRTCAGSGRRSSPSAAPTAGRSSTTRWRRPTAMASGSPSGSCRTTTSIAMPDWYHTSGAKRANAPTDKDGAIWSPDADDPLYAESGARWSSKRESATTAIPT